MDNFKIIYKILRTLEKGMDCEEFDSSLIGCTTLNISLARWQKIIKMLVDEGYVEGIRAIDTDTAGIIIKMRNPAITLRGLEYLHENSFMSKVAKIASGAASAL